MSGAQTNGLDQGRLRSFLYEREKMSEPSCRETGAELSILFCVACGQFDERKAHRDHESERAEVIDPAEHLALALALTVDAVPQVAEDQNRREQEDRDLACVCGTGQVSCTLYGVERVLLLAYRGRRYASRNGLRRDNPSSQQQRGRRLAVAALTRDEATEGTSETRSGTKEQIGCVSWRSQR